MSEERIAEANGLIARRNAIVAKKEELALEVAQLNKEFEKAEDELWDLLEVGDVIVDSYLERTGTILHVFDTDVAEFACSFPEEDGECFVSYNQVPVANVMEVKGHKPFVAEMMRKISA